MNPLYTLVADALGCQPQNLTPDSELGITPGWDSMAYLRILTELEKNYHIELNEDSVQRYKKLINILELNQE